MGELALITSNCFLLSEARLKGGSLAMDTKILHLDSKLVVCSGLYPLSQPFWQR